MNEIEQAASQQLASIFRRLDQQNGRGPNRFHDHHHPTKLDATVNIAV
jgi:hypothetical protein